MTALGIAAPAKMPLNPPPASGTIQTSRETTPGRRTPMSSTPQDGPRRRRWLWLAAGLALGMVWQLFWPEYTPDEDSPGPVGVWKVDGGGAKVFRYDGRYVTLEL